MNPRRSGFKTGGFGHDGGRGGFNGKGKPKFGGSFTAKQPARPISSPIPTRISRDPQGIINPTMESSSRGFGDTKYYSRQNLDGGLPGRRGISDPPKPQPQPQSKPESERVLRYPRLDGPYSGNLSTRTGNVNNQRHLQWAIIEPNKQTRRKVGILKRGQHKKKRKSKRPGLGGTTADVFQFSNFPRATGGSAEWHWPTNI